jgi:hypothetical protein
MVTQPAADLVRTLNPLRLSYTLFADSNPLMKEVEKLAVEVKGGRRPAAPNNPFLQMQQQASDQITAALDAYRDTRDRVEEELIFGIYGSPLVQGMLGLNSGEKVRELPGPKGDQDRRHDRLHRHPRRAAAGQLAATIDVVQQQRLQGVKVGSVE